MKCIGRNSMGEKLEVGGSGIPQPQKDNRKHTGWLYQLQGGGAGMPRQGVYGAVSDEDGNEGTLTAQAWPVHHDYTVVGQPNPPTVPQVQHVDSMEVPEREARQHCPVCQGGGSGRDVVWRKRR